VTGFKSFVVRLSVALSLLTVVSCASIGGSLDRSWRLAGWTLSSLDPRPFRITARFEDGAISGYTGVNHYRGLYRLGAANSFSVQINGKTERAGTEPEMRAEDTYIALLSQARAYNTAGDALVLYDQNGNESLRFEAIDK